MRHCGTESTGVARHRGQLVRHLILTALLVFSSSAVLGSCSTPSSGAQEHLANGRALQTAGQWQQAIIELTRAIEMDPGLAYAYIYRGECHDALGQYDQALADQTEAIEMKPNEAFAYYSRGITYLHKANLDSSLLVKAVADFTRAIDLNPKDADAYRSRSTAYGRNRQYDLAEADLAKVRQLSDDPVMINDLSKYLDDLKKGQPPAGFVPSSGGHSDNSAALAPARDLTGEWVGTGVFYTSNLLGERASKVTARVVFTLEQAGNSVTGSYQIYPTSQEPLSDIWVPLASGSGHALTGTATVTNLTLSAGGLVFGGSGSIEQWTFTFTTDLMHGGVTNMDTGSYTGLDSDQKAISLTRQ